MALSPTGLAKIDHHDLHLLFVCCICLRIQHTRHRIYQNTDLYVACVAANQLVTEANEAGIALTIHLLITHHIIPLHSTYMLVSHRPLTA